MEGPTKLGVVGLSWLWFRAAPLLALGHACLVVVAAATLPFGVGWWLLPRALGKLTAHQLGLEGLSPLHALPWRVGPILFAPAVMLFAMLGLLVQVSALADPLRWGLPSPWGSLLWRACLLGLSAALTSALTAPFAFASAWHAEHAGGVRRALRASLAVSHVLGGARAWAWTALSLALPVSGGCVLFSLSSRFGPETNPVLMFGAALLWLASIPVARGWLCACYVAQWPVTASRPDAPDDEPFPRALSVALGGGALLMVGLLLTCLALVRPSPLGPGGSLADAPLELRIQAGEGTRSEVLTAAGLTVEVSPGAVALVTRDGGGVGRLPLPEGSRVRSAAVARTGPRSFRADIDTDRGRYAVDFDAEGVRTDDALSDRFEAALAPAWQLLLALCVCGTGWALGRVASPVAGQSDLRRAGWVYLPALVAMLLGLAALLRWRAFP